MIEIALAVIVVALVILLYLAGSNCARAEYEDFMTGIWRGDPGFCEEAGISSMMLHIGGRTDTSMFTKRTRECYLIMNNDICNQAFTMSYSAGSPGYCQVGTYVVDASLAFDEDQTLPEHVTCEFNMTQGTLRIYSGGVLYGLLYRDAELSLLADEVTE